MASSDEEGEIVPDTVEYYAFFNSRKEPISFSDLPLCWRDSEPSSEGLALGVFLRGVADGGLRKIFKQVVGWRLELSLVRPEICVLTKDNSWVELQKPRRGFEGFVGSILAVVHWVHIVKRNLGAPGSFIWTSLQKVMCLYGIHPAKADILAHKAIISEIAKRDRDLSNSTLPGEEKTECGRNDGNDDIDTSDSDELFDTVCAFCDNGGEVLCCEGGCLRCFHATVEAGAESLCHSLGYSEMELNEIWNFCCENCRHQQHQCCACGKLGSSDKSSKTEVFCCISATCTHFYHPKCVAKLLYPGNEILATELEEGIAAGKYFTCPQHKCSVCRRTENKDIYDLQFAVCRRCPKAYHRKCLPREIYEDSVQRAWENLLPKSRILIYCMDHAIDREIGTPSRDHIVFPNIEGKKMKHTICLKLNSNKVVEKKGGIDCENLCNERTAGKVPEQVGGNFDRCSAKSNEKSAFRLVFDPAKKRKIYDFSREVLKDKVKSIPNQLSKSLTDNKSRLSLKDTHSMLAVGSRSVTLKQRSTAGSATNYELSAGETNSSHDSDDPEMEKRMLALMKQSTSLIKREDFMKQQNVPSVYARSSKHAFNMMTAGKLERMVKAVNTAAERFEDGCNIEDVKAICGPEVFYQLASYKRKLSVYLAPFLHGPRYTSFGRHFTKVDRLKKIVDRLHWYVQNGDMIVDFSCGSNDFSCLMKEKLDEMGKKCYFKNYDLHPPKHNFNFEQRNWMTVGVGELPAGSQLIMGLNPPFGVKASLANMFIDKALEFQPKLLVLIVPKETKRLNERAARYDMIWEDEVLLAGKSFYLPGSVDVNNKPLEQWNMRAPPLYLWSRPDFTALHREIAENHGHIVRYHADVDKRNAKPVVSNYLLEENYDCYGDFSDIVNAGGDISGILEDIPDEYDSFLLEETQGTASEQHLDSFCIGDNGTGSVKRNGIGKKICLENLYEAPSMESHNSGMPFQIDEPPEDMEHQKLFTSPYSNASLNCWSEDELSEVLGYT